MYIFAGGSNRLPLKYNFKKEIKDLYLGDKKPELLPILDNALSELSNLPTKQMKEVLEIIEHKRDKNMNLIMMVISAMLGGSAGAWLTNMLK